jgi:PP-loop superfamily ATP-utilizing enzyme
MRPEVLDRLNTLNLQKISSGYKDGWLYGMLEREFDLSPDELSFLATKLGFKYGWNPTIASLLERQWETESVNVEILEDLKAKENRAAELKARQRELTRLQDEATHRNNALKLESEKRARTFLLEHPNLVVADRPFTKMEKSIIWLTIQMSEDDQKWVLEQIYERFHDA